MSWKIKTTDAWADKCRFAVRAALFVNAMILALASIYITGQIVWHLVRFLNRTIFSAPW